MKDVERAIAASNANVGGDLITLGTQSHNVRAVGLLGGGIDPLDPRTSTGRGIEIEKLDDLRDVVVATSPEGTPIYVRNVAQVIVAHRPRLGIVGRGQEDDVVEGIVMMRRGEKSLATSKAVLAKMAEIEEDRLLPKGMHLEVFDQRTDLVQVTTHNVLHNLMVGIGLVIVVLFVFLGDVTSAAIVALVIPLALMFAITVLFYHRPFGQLAVVGCGRLRDHRRQLGDHRRDDLPAPDRAWGRPFASAGGPDHRRDPRGREADPVLDDDHRLCVHTPLHDDRAGRCPFGPMAATYAFSILGALLTSVTLIPVLCSFLFHGKKERRTRCSTG